MTTVQTGTTARNSVPVNPNSPIVTTDRSMVAAMTCDREVIIDQPHGSPPDPKTVFVWRPVS